MRWRNKSGAPSKKDSWPLRRKVVRCKKQSDVLSDKMWYDVESRGGLRREKCGAMTKKEGCDISRTTLRCREKRRGDQRRYKSAGVQGKVWRTAGKGVLRCRKRSDLLPVEEQPAARGRAVQCLKKNGALSEQKL